MTATLARGAPEEPGAPRPVWNPLLEAYVACVGRRGPARPASSQPCSRLADLLALSSGTLETRRHLVSEYAFSVPTEQAVQEVVRFAPSLVDFGAGTGYWAQLLTEAGADVVALDHAEGANEYMGQRIGRWYQVRPGGVPDLAAYRARALFLAWPPYEDRMAADALAAWGGDRLVYVGEACGGCTASDDFFAALAADFVKVAYVALPQWPGIHDALWLYERAGGAR